MGRDSYFHSYEIRVHFIYIWLLKYIVINHDWTPWLKETIFPMHNGFILYFSVFIEKNTTPYYLFSLFSPLTVLIVLWSECFDYFFICNLNVLIVLSFMILMFWYIYYLWSQCFQRFVICDLNVLIVVSFVMSMLW